MVTKEQIEKIKGLVRNIPDFPVPGIQFKDLTTLFKDGLSMHVLGDALMQLYADKGVTKVMGIESRGFIGGAVLADRLGAGFVPIRKPGKLPADTVKMSYEKEYGVDTIEIHKDAILQDDIVVIHDDLLATGGTMKAALDLVLSMKPKKVYLNCICELLDLHGRDVFPPEIEFTTLFAF